MTKELKQLKAIIQKAVPEIMEVKFNCEIKGDINYIILDIEQGTAKGGNFVRTHIASKKYPSINTVGEAVYENKNPHTYKDWEKWVLESVKFGDLKDIDLEILGRPIQLADVLRAIQKNDEDYPIHIDFFFDRVEKLTITQAKGHPIINKECNWDLTQDLDHQKPETIKFLLEILK